MENAPKIRVPFGGEKLEGVSKNKVEGTETTE
jgi:hypothetical protein